VSMIITALAALVLFVFYYGALTSGAFDTHKLHNIPYKGWYGIFAAMPYAVWFYLAIEQLPLSAEESYDAARDMPRALKWGMASLILPSMGTVILNSGVGPGAQGIGESAAPLEAGFRAVYASKVTSIVLAIISLTGLIASFHSIIYAYGRLLFALSRAGFLPAALAKLNGRQTPHVALIVGGAIGLVLCFLAQQYAGSVGAALLNMAVFGALLSYILVLLSFLKLRRAQPDLPRPYRSPLGVTGAYAGIALAATCLCATFAIESFRPGVAGTLVFIVAMLAYYFLYRRAHVLEQ